MWFSMWQTCKDEREKTKRMETEWTCFSVLVLCKFLPVPLDGGRNGVTEKRVSYSSDITKLGWSIALACIGADSLIGRRRMPKQRKAENETDRN